MTIDQLRKIRTDLPNMTHNDLERTAKELRAFVKETSGADLEDITHLKVPQLRERLSIWCDDIETAITRAA